MKGKLLAATLVLSAVTLFPSLSFAHDIASGCASTNDASVTNESVFTTMCSATLSLTDGTHYCVATGSAEAQNPGGVENQYLFTLATNSNPAPGSAWERKIELDDNVGINDPSTSVVSTVRYFNLSPGTYTFYWLAKPVDGTDANLTVNDYSMGVVCTDGV